MRYLIFLIFLQYSFLARSQHQDKVDFIHGKVDIILNSKKETITGRVVYKLRVLRNVDSVFLDAHDLQLNGVWLNRKKQKFTNIGNKIIIYKHLKAKTSYTLKIDYSAKPKQTVYFIGCTDDLPGNDQVWTQGQGKYTSHWLPSFDDMTEKVEFDLNITFDKNFEVIANGKLMGTKEFEGLKEWSFNMDNPMSSYLLAFAIGDYRKKQMLSNSGVPIGLYYYPRDSSFVEPTYRYSKEIFDFLENEIGVAYPWLAYNQIPVRDFLYSGMENTGTTIFSDSHLIDSIAFKDKNYVNVNAHELAHQWFGNLVTEVDGNSHWLHEGFATYYALLAEKEIFGKEFYYWKLYESAQQLQELSKKNLGESLMDPKASSLTFYEKGAWALHMLREQVGEKAFKHGIQKYLELYGFKNATIDDFLCEMEVVSGQDLNVYRHQWLKNTEFPMDEAKNNLARKSDDLRLFFKLQEEIITSSNDNETIISRYWGTIKSAELKIHIIKTYYKSLSENFIGEVLNSNNVMIRQSVAVSLEQLPLGLKSKFESLLKDKSYITMEQILYKLWINYPADRSHHLNETRNTIGFSNRNIRLLWLTLALLTKDFETKNTNEYYLELSAYTSPKYSFEIRQMAFQFLEELIGFSDQNLLDLINATQHHSWQFRKYSRTVLDKLLKQKIYKERIANLTVKLNKAELRYISNKLNTE